MTDETSIACSLGAGDLRQRLSEIAEVGADSLIGRSTDGDRHLLRFRADAQTRRRLAAIVTAEAKCCSFLDLSLEARSGELVLSIHAPDGGQPIADQLAAAFVGTAVSGASPFARRIEGGEPLSRHPATPSRAPSGATDCFATMFFSRVRSRCGKALGRPFDLLTIRQNSRCSLWVRLLCTRSRPLAASHTETAQTILQGIRRHTVGTARRAIQAGIWETSYSYCVVVVACRPVA
jgi:hypothetical protein